MRSILSRFAGPSPSSRGNVNDSMYRGKREYAKRKSLSPAMGPSPFSRGNVNDFMHRGKRL